MDRTAHDPVHDRKLCLCRGILRRQDKWEKLDAEVFKQTLSEAAGGEVDVENITDGGTTYDNGFFIMCSYERF